MMVSTDSSPTFLAIFSGPPASSFAVHEEAGSAPLRDSMVAKSRSRMVASISFMEPA
jgi:hypothetical protein